MEDEAIARDPEGSVNSIFTIIASPSRWDPGFMIREAQH